MPERDSSQQFTKASTSRGPADRVRPAVATLSAYRPGKGAKQAEAEHGIVDAIKLASNENPYPPVGSVVAAMQAAAAGVNRYGDHRASELREKIAEWLGVKDNQVAVGCGSVGLLQQLCLAFVDPGDEVISPWPSFEAYPVTVEMMNGVLVSVPLDELCLDLNAVGAAITDRTKLITLATPNNPTGTAVSTLAIKELLARVPGDVLVLIDEAYREFSDPGLGDPIADLVPRYRNVIVSRTFSKAYGLAGLRSGYLIADPAVIAEIDKVLLAFSVNMIAQAASLAVIDATADYLPLIGSLIAERDRVVAALRAAGWLLPEAQANFVYLATGERTDALALALERRGVVTRPFTGAGIRVTVGSSAENDRFLATLAEVS